MVAMVKCEGEWNPSETFVVLTADQLQVYPQH